MTDLQLFDLSTIPVDPFANLARLTDAQFSDLHDLTLDAVYAHEELVEEAAAAGIEVDPLPDDLVEAIAAHYHDLLAAFKVERGRRVVLRFRCLDCHVDTFNIGQYPYHCPDELWDAVVPDGRGMLCLACLATRLDAAGLPWPSTLRPPRGETQSVIRTDHDALEGSKHHDQ